MRGASGPDPEQSNTGYDVSGVSRKGESMRGGLPLSYRRLGGDPPGKIWEFGAGEAFFKPVLGQNVRFQT